MDLDMDGIHIGKLFVNMKIRVSWKPCKCLSSGLFKVPSFDFPF